MTNAALDVVVATERAIAWAQLCAWALRPRETNDTTFRNTLTYFLSQVSGISLTQAQRASDLAWQIGHASGYSEVLCTAEELCYVLTGQYPHNVI